MTRSIEVGSGCRLTIHEIEGKGDGPTLAVLGGVHGDELEGVTAARVLVATIDSERVRGRVRIVPVANPPAFDEASRCSPIDGLNLARRFPGAADGSVTDRIADAITGQVITGADMLIDLHSAGAAYEMPLFAGFVDRGATGPASEVAARAFGAPVLWVHDTENPGRSLTAAAALGVPSMYVEGSGGGGLRGRDLDGYIGGVWRVMAAMGMVDGVPSRFAEPARGAIEIHGGTGDVDASLATQTGGFCVTRARPGDVVRGGSLIAEILDDCGTVVEKICASKDGTLMLVRRRARVTAGDGIAMLGPVPIGFDFESASIGGIK